MQFVINNWYLFLALFVIGYMLISGPLMQMIHGIRTVPVSQAVRLMNHESAVVVDVREPDEYRSGHIPHAINIPLGTLHGRLREIEKFRDKPVLLSCRTSQRSARAAMILKKNGFAAAHILGGGITAWQKENLPTSK
jgi:rhodanese-related sulfurtransferase